MRGRNIFRGNYLMMPVKMGTQISIILGNDAYGFSDDMSVNVNGINTTTTVSNAIQRGNNAYSMTLMATVNTKRNGLVDVAFWRKRRQT